MYVARHSNSDIDMTCICDHAGYCPLLRTTMYPEQWEKCRTEEGFQAAEMQRRGIRSVAAIEPKLTKSQKPRRPLGYRPPADCIPCNEKKQPPKTMQRFISTHPVVTNRRERAALGLRDQFLGHSVFLIGGGPSLKQVDLTKLQQPGIILAAMNNVATVIRPHLWFSVDMPRNFHETIWRDPGIMKFTMDKYISKGSPIDAWDETSKQYVHSGLKVNECPNVWGFDHRHGWDAELFFDDAVPTWGPNDVDPHPSGKNNTVMLPTLWLLYWLGFRVIYLLGCDFRLGDGNYAFDEQCKPTNANLLPWIARRLKELRPYAEAKGLQILNATEGSALEAFDRISLDKALEATLKTWPTTVVTRGHYRHP